MALVLNQNRQTPIQLTLKKLRELKAHHEA